MNLYIFYEEYGYIIDFCGMQGLGSERLKALAEKVNVIETTKGQSFRYQYLSSFQQYFSNFQEASTTGDDYETKKRQVTEPVKAIQALCFQSDAMIFFTIQLNTKFVQITAIRILIRMAISCQPYGIRAGRRFIPNVM